MSWRKFWTGLGWVVGLGCLGPACSTPVKNLCVEVCACEHCDDLRESDLCNVLETAESVAQDYNCGNAFTAWIECQSREGQCIETSATWTTLPTGQCNAEYLFEDVCETDGDCIALGYSDSTYYCSAQRKCAQRVCSYLGSEGTYACTTDADCIAGTDPCTGTAQALETCQAEHSGHGGVALPSL